MCQSMVDIQPAAAEIRAAIIISGQSNLTTGHMAAANGRFSGIEGLLAPLGEYD